MKFTPYVNFNGDCAEAFRFYEQLFGGKIEMMMSFGESPMAGHMPPEHHHRIMHASLSVGDQRLMGSDGRPGETVKPQGTYISIHVTDPAEADRIFAALAEGGEVEMPIEKTFWAQRFGMTTDRFGIPWMINCE